MYDKQPNNPNTYAFIQCHNTQINVFNYALSDESRKRDK
jgi:hypothetical protein